MRNDVAEGGINIKEIGRVFRGIRKIIDEDEEQDWAQDCVGALQLDMERR